MQPTIIIPAYQPGLELLKLVDDLTSRDPAQKVIIVNDGSTGESIKIFETIARAHVDVDIVHHSVNLGKGQALKSGFNHFLLHYAKDCIGVVTADADGQHVVEDILRVSEFLQSNPQSLCLGSRMLDKDVPFRRLFGNKLTILIFKMVTKVALMDTQTGLRGIPTGFLYELMRSPESGYDFELDMLIRAARSGLNILETPIKTIYMENNQGSHFNYLRDSFKIYFVFLRFSMLSLATAAIDYLVFALCFWKTGNILLSIVAARLLAGTFQFSLAKFWVFKSPEKAAGELLKYALLVTGLMLLSYGLIIPMVMYLDFNPYLSKVIAEGAVFLLSFAAQNLFVYAPKSTESRKTDWDAYYNAPFKTAFISRRFTENKLHRLIEQFKPESMDLIYELGGGNSHFFEKLRARYPDAAFIIIDNNQHGLDIFSKQHTDADNARVINNDILDLQPDLARADFIFSIGLIEHFSPQGTARAIQNHFACAKPGALVLITFPTPTWLYIVARALTEAFGAWQFPDERPLSMNEVLNEVVKYGEVLHSSITWPVVFTQGVVVVRAK